MTWHDLFSEAIDSCDAEIIHGNNNVSDSVEAPGGTAVDSMKPSH